MDKVFSTIDSKPENEIFRVVFFPDRIYHAAYLNATVSSRYRYNVKEVRNKHDITLIKAAVYMDGTFLANVLRIEYQASRLVETTRELQRIVQDTVRCRITIIDKDQRISGEVKLGYCNWISAFQCEIWDTLQPLPGSKHNFRVLSQMGKNGTITRLDNFAGPLKRLDDINVFEVSFFENDIDEPFGYQINNTSEDNDYLRSYQVPNVDQPSAFENTVSVKNYLINFQRGWFLDANTIKPVVYSNAMMEAKNPAYRNDNKNLVEMRWIVQRELGGNLVYFHEVNVTPGSFEGVHQHIGSEELYYFTEGEGIAYMGENDDPVINAAYPTVKQEIYCIGERPVKEIPVKAGNVIYTKSGGIHGVKNTSQKPLKFVAFGYHCS